MTQPGDANGQNKGAPGYFAYKASQAVGSFSLVNYIFSYNISLRVQTEMKAKWPEATKPNHDAFARFLSSRPISDLGTLKDLLLAPKFMDDCWARCD